MHTRPDWRRHLARLRGSSIEFDLRAYAHPLTEINDLEAAVSKLSDEAIETRARTLREDVAVGTSLASVRTEVFALVREAARRALGLRPYDGQALFLPQRDVG